MVASLPALTYIGQVEMRQPANTEKSVQECYREGVNSVVRAVKRQCLLGVGWIVVGGTIRILQVKG